MLINAETRGLTHWLFFVMIKSMKKLKTVEEVLEEIAKIKLQPPHKLTSTKYPDKVVFKCGCGKSHRVNDPSNRVFSVAVPVKFVIDCENGYVTFFQVKGHQNHHELLI